LSGERIPFLATQGAIRFVALAFIVLLAGCTANSERPLDAAIHSPSTVRIERLRNLALSWHIPSPHESIRGLRLFDDAPRPAAPGVAIVRSIVRANPRIGSFDALILANSALAAADRNQIDGRWFASTILQESAFDPLAISWAGAYGIAQFTPETAETYGVDALDPFDAIRGAARLLGRYRRAYASDADPYALADAAYNAGPGAVSRYHGVPPYAETREYISDIVERWARIAQDESPLPRARRR